MLILLTQDGSNQGCVALGFNILRTTGKVLAEEGQAVIYLLRSAPSCDFRERSSDTYKPFK